MRRLALVCLGVLLLLGAGPASAQDLKKLRVTIPVPAFTFYPLFVGADKGFFAKQGFEPEIITTSGDGPDVDALIAGSVDFTVSTPNRLLTAYEQGKPLLGVMNLLNRLAIECAMHKPTAEKLGITADSPLEQKLKSLKGLTAAGTRPGAFSYLLAVNMVKRAGLEPQKDVQLIGLGGPQAMLPALENGQVAVACTGSPLPDLAVAHGKAVALTANAAGKDPEYDNFLFEVLYVRPDWAKQNAETVRKVTRAFTESVGWIRDTSSADQLPVLRKRFSGVPDEVLVTILDNLRPAFKPGGRITQGEVEKAQKFLIDTGVQKAEVPWDKVTSNEYLD